MIDTSRFYLISTSKKPKIKTIISISHKLSEYQLIGMSGLQMLLFLVFLTFIEHIVAEDVLVTLPTGQIRGSTKVTHYKNVTFYAFQQIPFGQPPVGNLRFMPPQPVEKWDGILDCTENKKMCYQMQSNNDLENEDCLFLNVYTPVQPGSNASLPVMFYIFGGAFIYGNSIYTTYAPHFFVEQDVIIVTVNYRIGSFGFLSSGDEVISGNMGLKDQLLGLEWVRDNIHLFGGDKFQVTIFGDSAGAAAVTYHVLSKQSSGLFRAAIGQSGSAICPWAYQRNARSIAYQIANFIDPNFGENKTSQELLDFLQGVNASVLDAAAENLKEVLGHETILQGTWFAPVMEPNIKGAFFTDYMYETLEQGNINNVSLMIGICSEEGIRRAADLDKLKSNIAEYDKNLTFLINDDFHITNPDDLQSLGSDIRSIYTNGLLQDDLSATVRYFSDVSYSKAIIRHAQLQSKFTDVYFYQFAYHGVLGGNNVTIDGADRVRHAEDNMYLWPRDANDDLSDFPDEDVLTVNRFVTLFANFAKTLNPTPQKSDLFENIIWPKVEPNNIQYLNINDTLEVRTSPKAAVYDKWVKLYDQKAVRPMDTY